MILKRRARWLKARGGVYIYIYILRFATPPHTLIYRLLRTALIEILSEIYLIICKIVDRWFRTVFVLPPYRVTTYRTVFSFSGTPVPRTGVPQIIKNEANMEPEST